MTPHPLLSHSGVLFKKKNGEKHIISKKWRDLSKRRDFFYFPEYRMNRRKSPQISHLFSNTSLTKTQKYYKLMDLRGLKNESEQRQQDICPSKGTD
jgi:hypothetical protein